MQDSITTLQLYAFFARICLLKLIHTFSVPNALANCQENNSQYRVPPSSTDRSTLYYVKHRNEQDYIQQIYVLGSGSPITQTGRRARNCIEVLLAINERLMYWSSGQEHKAQTILSTHTLQKVEKLSGSKEQQSVLVEHIPVIQQYRGEQGRYKKLVHSVKSLLAQILH